VTRVPRDRLEIPDHQDSKDSRDYRVRPATPGPPVRRESRVPSAHPGRPGRPDHRDFRETPDSVARLGSLDLPALGVQWAALVARDFPDCRATPVIPGQREALDKVANRACRVQRDLSDLLDRVGSRELSVPKDSQVSRVPQVLKVIRAIPDPPDNPAPQEIPDSLDHKDQPDCLESKGTRDPQVPLGLQACRE
jgi:hypothetical protein